MQGLKLQVVFRAGRGFGMAEAKDDYGNLQDLGSFGPRALAVGFWVFLWFFWC